MHGSVQGRQASGGGDWRPSQARRIAVLLALVALAMSGCRNVVSGTDRMVPRGWQGNPWGPKANAARLLCEIPAVPDNPDMAAWRVWGRRHLRDGDIVFRMGNARAALGLLPFSRLEAAIAGSRFSHSGIVAIEEGEPVVYDTSSGGPQHQPFPIWILDAHGSIAVKRPIDPEGNIAPAAVSFCRTIYRKQVPFDFGMKLGDEEFYCIELTERAYRSAGLPLSDPIRIDHLPRYRDFPIATRLIRLFSPINPEQRAYVIGNETIGIWSSPDLELLYQAPDARFPLVRE